jgi:hypothetical protein
MGQWHWIAARNMFYLKQVELDEAQYILGLQVRSGSGGAMMES